MNKKSEGLKTCHDFNRKWGHVGSDGVTSVQEIKALRDQQEKERVSTLMRSMECKKLLDIQIRAAQSTVTPGSSIAFPDAIAEWLDRSFDHYDKGFDIV